MTKNFTIITRRPTPNELLDKLTHIFPAFLSIWERDDNLFVNKDGTYSVHGVFSVFSTFLRDNFQDIEEQKLERLFEYVEECVKTDVHSESGVSNAACTCFLENLTGEGELSKNILRFMGEKSKEYFDKRN